MQETDVGSNGKSIPVIAPPVVTGLGCHFHKRASKALGQAQGSAFDTGMSINSYQSEAVCGKTTTLTGVGHCRRAIICALAVNGI